MIGTIEQMIKKLYPWGYDSTNNPALVVEHYQ